MKIYVASSWRNQLQQQVVKALQDAGHEVYDFRNPAPLHAGSTGGSIALLQAAERSKRGAERTIEILKDESL